jgi:hypothetical protein
MATLLSWSKEEEIRYLEDLEKYIHDAVVPLDNEEQPYIQSI